MYKIFLRISLFVLSFTFNAFSQPPAHAEWDLVWNDEFNGVNSDLDKGWNSFNGGYISTFINCSRWRRNATVSDGTLKMYYKKEKTSGGTGASAWSYDWTAASLSTKKKFRFGYFECRYKIVASKHTNNSFWLISGSDNAGKKFEIDINEGQYSSNEKDAWKQIRTNVHNWTDIRADNSHPQLTFHTNPSPWQDISADFHVFGLEWNENELLWYLDGKLIRRSANKNQDGYAVNCFGEAPVYLSAATLRQGMTNGAPLGDDLNGKFMEVDWVRVYQKRKESNLLLGVVGTPLSVITYPEIPDETTYSWEVSTFDPATNSYNPWRVLGNWGTAKTSTNGFGSTYDIRKGDTLIVTNFNRLMNKARFRCLLTSNISTINSIPSNTRAYTSPYQRYSSVDTLMVSMATPEVNWPAPADIVYGTVLSSQQLNATASVKGKFVYDPASATLLNAGNSQVLSVIFTPTDSLSYNAVTKQVSINVKKASQTITFTALSSKTYGDAPFALSATSSSGLPLTYSSSNTGVASISDNTVTIVGVGTATITASQEGNNNYNPASSPQSLTVNKAPQIITFASLSSKTYGDAPFVLSGTSSTGLPLVYVSSDPTVASVDGNMVTIIGAGTTVIEASLIGDANHQAAAAQQVLTVNKANQTISFAPLPTILVNSPAFALTAAASSSLPIAYSTTSNNITLTNGSVGIIGAGRATITATQSGSPNYNAAEPVSQSFCINPAKPSIVISNLNTPNPLLTSSAPEGNQWYLDGVAIAGATGATYMATKSGSYQVRVTIDSCTGEFADEQPVVITSVEIALPLAEVYPNPVTGDLLFISFGGMRGKKLVTVFSLTGKALVASSSESGSASIDVGHLSAGNYFVKVIIEGCVKTIRFQKLDSR